MCVPSVNGKSYGMATYLILLMFDTRWQSIDWHYLDSMAWSVTVARCCAHVSFIMPQKENCEEKWKEKWGEETTSLTDKSIFVTQVAEAGRRKKFFLTKHPIRIKWMKSGDGKWTREILDAKSRKQKRRRWGKVFLFLCHWTIVK